MANAAYRAGASLIRQGAGLFLTTFIVLAGLIRGCRQPAPGAAFRHWRSFWA